MAAVAYAELHCHTNFSFLDGASTADELVERAVEIGLSGLAVTDHRGLYGAVRFVSAAESVGLHPVVGLEIELRDSLASDPSGIVIPARRSTRRRGRPSDPALLARQPVDGRPARPRAERARLPGHREPVKEDARGIGERQRGPHLVLLARNPAGYRSLCRLISRANLAGTKSMPRFSQALLADNTEGLVALSGCRDGEIARRLRVGDREGARAVAEAYAGQFGGFYLELEHHLLPEDDWLVAQTADLAAELGLPVVVTNDVHYALREDREMHDVLTAIRHGRTLETLADLRRPDSESYLKSGDDLASMPPGSGSAMAPAWREGLANAAELAASCSVDLGFEQYRFPGFEVPATETPFSYLSSLCWDGARQRYHPLTSAVVNRLAHELDVIERAGLAEFFLICWDLMQFARKRGIPAQGRGSATSSIVSYTLGISRVEPIQHNLLFERFINEGRTTYPDVDIDFSSARREEVIQYIYDRYGEEHTGMVCNLVTYRARSAVREIGYALGFPRPLVDRVAKALETYDSVMVRRDLEADGGFAEFFRRPGEGELAEGGAAGAAAAVEAQKRGLVDGMGQLNHARGGRVRTGGVGEAGTGRLPREEDIPRVDAVGEERVDVDVGEQLVDGMGQLNSRVPLVGKVPPWRQPPRPVDPDAPRPFHWIAEIPLGADAGRVGAGAVEAGAVEAGAVEAGAVAAGEVAAGEVAAGEVAAGVVEAGAVEADMMEPGCVDADQVEAPEAHALRVLPPLLANGLPTAENATDESIATSIGEIDARIGEFDARNGVDPDVAGPDSGRVRSGYPLSNHAGDTARAGDIAAVDGTRQGPSASGMWEGAPESPPSIRAGGRSDDKGGPGDTPASVAWLRAGRGTGWSHRARSAAIAAAQATVAAQEGLRDAETGGVRPQDTGLRALVGGIERASSSSARADTPAETDRGSANPSWNFRSAEGLGAGDARVRPADGLGAGDGHRTADGLGAGDAGNRMGDARNRTGDARVRPADARPIVEVDPESGMPLPPPRKTDRLGRPSPWDPPAPPTQTMGRGGDKLGRPDAHSSVARVEPEPSPQPRGGSTRGMSDWERWLEFCARIDGFPRHLSIHSGGMLVTAAPLIDIAPLERATMPDRVVVQFDKRDVEELKLIKLDLLGLGMLSAIDETVQLIEHDCAVCLNLDRLPEEIGEVFDMLQAADTVGVFQVESRAQMQTLPKSRPGSLDDLVVEVAIIRPGPIQGNAVHPYLRRKQGLEPVTYLHPSLEPVLRDSLGVILYQEQVMRIAIEVAGFSPAESDGFRRAMGTWRSNREMEKLHARFVEGGLRQPGMTEEDAEELFRQCAAFASFGFAKSHAAAFARTAYESSFLKLFYPAQFLTGLINAQPMGFYPVEVLVNDAKRHGVTVLPVDVNSSSYKTTTEWVGRPGWVLAGAAGDDGSHDGDPGEPLPDDCGVESRPAPVRSTGCVVPSTAAREQWAAENAVGWGVRLGLSLVKGIGEQHEELLDAELARGPYRSLADVVERTGLPEETIERLIRAGALDSLGRPRRELLWQLREVAGASRGRVDGRVVRPKGASKGRAAGRPMDLRLPATDAPDLPPMKETERIGDAYATVGLDARQQVVGLFRGALDRLGAVSNGALADRKPGDVRIGGLVVTRQHPMTARGTVFLALEDETGMVNVTLWPKTWAALRGIVRRHALLLIDGELQREANVVNVVARDVRPLVEVAHEVGGPDRPEGIRQLGHAGMRRLG